MNKKGEAASGLTHSAEGSAGSHDRRTTVGASASGHTHSAEGRFAIVRATFYKELAERLTQGALKGFGEEGIAADHVDTYDVPGAFELPVAAKACAASGRYAGVACLGTVIRGETDHYDYVCAAAAYGIELVQIETSVPCTFGVLTVENREQALARSGGDKRDQGYNAARTAVQMARLLGRIPASS